MNVILNLIFESDCSAELMLNSNSLNFFGCGFDLGLDPEVTRRFQLIQACQNGVSTVTKQALNVILYLNKPYL